MVTPCRPSAPPVSQSSLLASSYKMSAKPSVTISRVRSLPRKMVSDITAPASAETTVPATSPVSGSPVRCLASKPAA